MLSVVLVAVAFLLFKFLTSATMYFCDADQVGVKSECSGAKRFVSAAPWSRARSRTRPTASTSTSC